MNRKFSIYFEMEIFCKIKNAFTVTFDQFKSSLLKKKEKKFFFQKILVTPNFWTVMYINIKIY